MGIALNDWYLGFKRRLSPPAFPAQQVRRPGAQPVVFLPGIWERWTASWLWARSFYKAGYDVHFVPELDLELGSMEDLSDLLLEWIGANLTQPPIIVGHSKGGLVAKSALVKRESALRGIVACGTPFEGSPMASIAPLSMRVRNLRPESAEIQQLAAHTQENAKVILIEARWDQNVPHIGRLPGGAALEAPVDGHNQMLEDPETARLVTEAVIWIDKNWP